MLGYNHDVNNAYRVLIYGALKKNNGNASNPIWVDTTVPIAAKNVPLFREGSLLATLDK